jgi:hypothetical protein
MDFKTLNDARYAAFEIWIRLTDAKADAALISAALDLYNALATVFERFTAAEQCAWMDSERAKALRS